MVPRTPIEATGVVTAVVPPVRLSVRPDMNRNAPLATEAARSPVPRAGSYTNLSMVIRALEPTVKIERSRSSTCNWLCGPLLIASPRCTDSRSTAGRGTASLAVFIDTWLRIAALTPIALLLCASTGAAVTSRARARMLRITVQLPKR